MEKKELEDLISGIPTKDLKAEAKKLGISCWRCPKKIDIAWKLPPDLLKKMAGK